MNTSTPENIERYLIYPNESVDKLTVNRPLQRIFEAIENKIQDNELSLVEASDKVYGAVKFSPLTAYYFSEDAVPEDSKESYKDDILNVYSLNNFAKSLNDVSKTTRYYTISDEDESAIKNTNYWIKSDCSEINFNYLPNGVNMITGTFDIGFNNIPAIFDSEKALSSNISTPVTTDRYNQYINITDEDELNFRDYVTYNSFVDVADVNKLKEFNGKQIDIPLNGEYSITMKHNICNWTTYSSYKQSYVELHYSSSIDVNSLYSMKFGRDVYEMYKNGNKESLDKDTRELDHSPIVFKQKPIIMMQIGFYNNESNSRPIFGFDNTNSETATLKESLFDDYNTISQKPLTVEENELSPVNGMVMVKKFENEYDDNGIVSNNVIHYDVVMKFMVGSAADPKMIHGLTSINSKAKIQFALIGV